MCIKKFKNRFNKAYSLAIVMGITMSLLGVSYGYWSDEKIIEATVEIPKLELKDKNMGMFRSMASSNASESINVDLNNLEEEISFSVDIKTEEGNESSIPLKCEADDCKIYLTGGPGNLDEKGAALENLISGDPIIDEREGTYDITIKLITSQLKTIMNADGETYIKIKLNFKQKDVPDGEKGWEYLIEKVYEVHVIPEVVIPEVVVIPKGVILGSVTPEDVVPGSVMSEGVIPGSVTPKDVIPGSVTPEDVIPGSIIPESAIPGSVISESVIPDSGATSSETPNSGTGE